MKHGQKVTIKGYLERRTETRYKGMDTETWKVWKPINFKAPKEGILIGERTLQNGTKHWDEMIHFNPMEYFTAYLVSLNMNKNPVYVRPIDIIKTI